MITDYRECYRYSDAVARVDTRPFDFGVFQLPPSIEHTDRTPQTLWLAVPRKISRVTREV